jgi:hypothetical protein
VAITHLLEELPDRVRLPLEERGKQSPRAWHRSRHGKGGVLRVNGCKAGKGEASRQNVDFIHMCM